jgi:hypothetical protein
MSDVADSLVLIATVNVKMLKALLLITSQRSEIPLPTLEVRKLHYRQVRVSDVSSMLDRINRFDVSSSSSSLVYDLHRPSLWLTHK